MKLADKDITQLFHAILCLESFDECGRFFEDLCTINELQSLAQRLEVARMLKEGYTYIYIEEKTGASTATISRVKRFLNHGSDGYQSVLARLSQTASVSGVLEVGADPSKTTTGE